MFGRLRGVIGRIFTPIARALLRLGVTPDAVTITGTVAVVAASFGLIARGYLAAGAWVIALFVLFDALDGTMARLAGTSGPWGSYLDSVLDRIADGALFAALAVYLAVADQPWGAGGALAALALGAVVPYARAKAESLGATASGGFAERADRLVLALVATAFVGMGLVPVVVLTVALWLLAVLSLITVVQRSLMVRAQVRTRPGDSA